MNDGLLDVLLQQVPALVWVTDVQHRILRVNPALAQFLCTDAQCLLGRTWRDAASEQGIEITKGKLDEDTVLQAGHTVFIDPFELRAPDGTTTIYRLTLAPLPDADGTIVGTVAIAVDVSEQTATERNLREREWASEHIMRIAGIGTWRRDIDSGRLTWHAGTERIWGIDSNLTQPAFDRLVERVHPDQRESFVETRNRVMREGGRFEEQVHIVWPDGSDHYARTIGETLMDDAGRPSAMLGLTQDLTEQVLAEQALRESEEQVRAILESLPYSFTIVDQATGRLVAANKAFRQEFGFGDGLEDRHAEELYAEPAERAEILEEFRRYGKYGPREIEIRRQNGDRAWMLASGTVISYSGRPAYLTTWANVTERREMEQALRASEQRFRDLVEGSIQGIVMHQHRRPLFVNQAFAELHGYDSPDEILALDSLDELVADSDRERRRRMAEARAAGRPIPEIYETANRAKDGTTKHLLVASRTVNWEGQEAVQSTVVDITDRMVAEEQLRESQHLLRLVIDSLPLNIHVKNPAGTYVLVNRAMASYHGMTPKEIIGLRNADLPGITADQAAALDAADLAVLDTRQPVDFEPMPFADAQGNSRHYSMRKLPVLDETGRSVAVLGVAEDVTEKLAAEQELRASRNFLRTLVDTLPLAVWAKRRDGTYTLINRAFAQARGLTTDQITELNRGEFARPSGLKLSEGTQSSNAEQDRRVFELGQTLEVPEDQQIWSDGSVTWRHVVKAPIVIADGRVEELAGFHVDITERKELEAQVLASQRMEAVGRLAGGIAHDFNNMLTVIRGFCDVLRYKLRQTMPPPRELEKIEGAADRAATLVQQLLAFSRRQPRNLADLDLNSVIQSFAPMLRQAVREGVRMDFQYRGDLPTIRADHGQIEQVLMNLVLNARDAMPDGGRLEIRTDTANAQDLTTGTGITRANRYVCLTVTDTGHGMDPDVRSRIFDPFFTTKEVGKGTGLGLSTVYGIVRQMDGEISVHSEPQVGTTFQVYFPAVEAAAADPTPVAARDARLRGTETLLLVEDEQMVREATAEILTGQGYTILSAGSGEEALEIVEQYKHPIQLLLTDVVMQGMRGQELARKALQARPGLSIVYMTGYADDALPLAEFDSECALVIRKPFTTVALLATLREALRPSGS